MKANCEYCGSEIDNTLEECPHCGAKNPNFQRTVTGTPKTIDELKAFCDSKGLKLDTMHIHLGEDFKEPKAFGIYKNEKNGHFVVYKNKANGQRAIRYDGTDEAYAVNELYLKIKDLLNEAREATAGKPRPTSTTTRPGTLKRGSLAYVLCWIALILIAGWVIILGIIGAFRSVFGNKNGYYEYRGDRYYRHGSYWYTYDENDEEWEVARNIDEYVDKDDYLGSDYDRDYDVEEFPTEDYSSDWESDSDWDDDDDYDWNDSYDDYDWGGDSGGVDWDSDWRIRFDFGDFI